MTFRVTRFLRYLRVLVIITVGLTVVSFVRQRLVKDAKVEQIMSQIMSTGLDQELMPRIVTGPKVETRENLYDLDTYHYDFARAEAMHGSVAGFDTRAVLRRIFLDVTANIPAGAHTEKWLRFSDFVSRRIRHPPLTQPMYEDKKMITHPLVLLLLGEGRCGHVARLIVDVALTNDYKARLVQLSAHLVAEIEWEGRWHFIDANADFPLQSIKAVFNELPSIEELSENPYLIDQLPARGWMWSERDNRSVTRAKLPYAMWYPGPLLTSSVYFAEQLLHNKYSGDPNMPRSGMQYWNKNGTFADWQVDRFYGWNDLILSAEQVITPIQTEFHPMPIALFTPVIIYATGDTVEIPVRFFPAARIMASADKVFDVHYDRTEVSYEVRVSSTSRGWNYDFRNYDFMPGLGQADIAKYSSITEYDGGIVGVDIKLPEDYLKQLVGETEVFIEVVPQFASLQARGYFAWPSRESSVQIYSPAHYQRRDESRN